MICLFEKDLFIKSTFFSYVSKIIVAFSAFAYTFLIANFLGPEKYGVVIFFMNFAGSIVLLFGTDAISETLTVFLPINSSKNLFLNLLKIQMVIAFVFFLIFLLLSNTIVNFFNKGTTDLVSIISFLVLFVPFSVFFPAVFRGFKSFGKVLKLSVIESVSNLFFAFLFVIFLKLGIFGVVYAKIVSFVILIVLSLFYVKRIDFKENVSDFESNSYLKKSAFFNFLKKSHEQSGIILLGFFVSPVFLGFYYLLNKISTYIILMPLNTLNEVFLPFGSEYHSDDKKLSELSSNVIRLSFISAVFLLIIFLGLASVLILFFFPAYVRALDFIFLFAFWYFLYSFNPLSVVFKVKKRLDILSKAYVLLIFFTITFGVVLAFYYSLAGFILSKIISSVLFFIYLWFSLKNLGISIDFVPKKRDFVFIKNTVFEFFNKFLKTIGK